MKLSDAPKPPSAYAMKKAGLYETWMHHISEADTEERIEYLRNKAEADHRQGRLPEGWILLLREALDEQLDILKGWL